MICEKFPEILKPPPYKRAVFAQLSAPSYLSAFRPKLLNHIQFQIQKNCKSISVSPQPIQARRKSFSRLFQNVNIKSELTPRRLPQQLTSIKLPAHKKPQFFMPEKLTTQKFRPVQPLANRDALALSSKKPCHIPEQTIIRKITKKKSTSKKIVTPIPKVFPQRHESRNRKKVSPYSLKWNTRKTIFTKLNEKNTDVSPFISWSSSEESLQVSLNYN